MQLKINSILQEIRKEDGQVLILAMLALVVIVMAIIFLFDISSVVKTRIKGQTAVDSAALTGANWQMHSLNMIGELNLVKATTMLITDIANTEETTEAIIRASDSVTDMQARISFVGPMIGFGAAQQAAKNNGLYNNNVYQMILAEHSKNILDNEGPYGQISDDIPNLPEEAGRKGYEWKKNYARMIDQSAGLGVAVSSNSNFINLASPPSFLYSDQFYKDVNGKNWCGLRSILEDEVFDDAGNDTFANGGVSIVWWHDYIEDDSPSPVFNKESEYIPINIDFASGTRHYERSDEYYSSLPSVEIKELEQIKEDGHQLLGDAYDEFNPDEDNDTDGKVNPLPLIQWAVYDGSWDSFTPHDSFQDGTWLKNKLKPQYLYGGAVSVFASQIQPETLSGIWGWNSEANRGRSIDDIRYNSGTSSTIGEELTDVDQSWGSRLKDDEMQIRRGLGTINVMALAKPLGALYIENETQPRPPNSTNIILPVFNMTSIMPASIDPRGADNEPNWMLHAWISDCLPELKASYADSEDSSDGQLDTFKDWVRSKYQYSYENYLRALELFNNPAFRKEGYDWLNKVVRVPLRDEEGNLVYDDEGEVIYTEEFRKEHCNPPTPGGTAPDGPGRLI